MCQQDWLQFDEFYKNIKAKKVNIYSLGVGPNLKIKTSNANFVYKHENGDDNNDEFY